MNVFVEWREDLRRSEDELPPLPLTLGSMMGPGDIRVEYGWQTL